MTTATVESVAAKHGLTVEALQWQFDRMDEGKTLEDAARALNAAQLYSPLTLCDVAACLWEAALGILQDEAHPAHAIANNIRANYGTATLRDSVTSLSIECETAWRALGDEGQEAAGCFDWDFCPDWLCEKLDWPSR